MASSLESFGRGVGFGIFFTLLLQLVGGYYLYSYITRNRVHVSAGSNERESKPTTTEDWPQPVVDYLRRSLQPSSTDSPITHEEMQAMSPTVDCSWLNLYLHRLFLVLRMSDTFKSVWSKKMNNKINLRLKGNTFISDLRIVELDLGEYPPELKGMRLLKGITSDLALMSEIDIEYRGGASIAVELTLANGSVIPAKVNMNQLNGTIQTRLPSERWGDMYGFHFVEDPGITLVVDTPITLRDNETVRSMINKVLSSLLRRTFLDLWVSPSWRTTFIPLMEPGLEAWLIRQELDKQLDQSKKVSPFKFRNRLISPRLVCGQPKRRKRFEFVIV
jgi:hypothetical protein